MTMYGNESLYDLDNRPMIVMYINIVAIPIFVLIGVVGNGISFIVLLSTHLRTKSSSIYLAALNVVDTGFLISLIPAWLGWLRVDVFHMNGWCQATIYAAYVFAFLSVWLVVSFTAERFVIVFFPLMRSSICTTKRALLSVCLITVIGLLLYSYTLFTTSVQQHQGLATCMAEPKHHPTLEVLSVVDTVITLVLPCVCVLVLNGSIYWKLSMHYKQYQLQSLCCSSNQNNYEESEMLHYIPNQRSGAPFSISAASLKLHKERRFQNSTTRTLLIISSVFLLLNLPSHAFRIYVVSMALYGGGHEYILSATMSSVQELCLLLYYANFSCNLFLYSVCSRGYRLALIGLYNQLKARLQTFCSRCQRRRIYFTWVIMPQKNNDSHILSPSHHICQDNNTTTKSLFIRDSNGML